MPPLPRGGTNRPANEWSASRDVTNGSVTRQVKKIWSQNRRNSPSSVLSERELSSSISDMIKYYVSPSIAVAVWTRWRIERESLGMVVHWRAVVS
mmetsp:Transcript_58382/g.79584  ORF Transcript_58382/g.79584 Transcript_58382/m.79584 type:complete len:95 (-) Transcript_58382:1791-2075(-)